MTNDEIPIFPTQAPSVCSDPAAITALFDEVFSALAGVVAIEDGLERSTPCAGFDVAALRDHTLGWLQFFAAALGDPTGTADRIDPNEWTLGSADAVAIVEQAAADFATAIDSGVAGELVLMQEARMQGDGVLAMALGEYLIHGWDLAVSTRQEWKGSETAAAPALEFLQSTVAPEYRGPDTGFFDEEVEPRQGASAVDRLLCFAGRDPYEVRADS